MKFWKSIRSTQSSMAQVEEQRQIAPEWTRVDTDAGLTTTSAPAAFKPINIWRSDLAHPYHFMSGDTCRLEIRDYDVLKTYTPEFKIEKNMTADHALRFEVRDELGMDCGIGFILGQKKR